MRQTAAVRLVVPVFAWPAIGETGDLTMSVFKTLLLSAAVFLPAAPAHAHLGHFGEVAGHAHWVAVGALAVAAAVAALAARRDADDDELEDADVEDAPAEDRSERSGT